MTAELKLFLLVYLCVVSFVSFVVCVTDKCNSKKRGRRRVPEKTLFWLAAMGGSLGGLLAMRLFRHKTKKPAFTVGFGLLLVLQAAVLGWLMHQNVI